jgi:hypothetical protein
MSHDPVPGTVTKVSRKCDESVPARGFLLQRRGFAVDMSRCQARVEDGDGRLT